MATFTIRVTSSALNAAGKAFGQSPDLGAPSFLDMIVSGSSDPSIPNGVYDAYCLNPLIPISPSASYAAENSAGNTLASFTPVDLNSLSQVQVDQLNWLLSQNFTSDPKYASQFNYGEVQEAIWTILGFTSAQIGEYANDANGARFLNDNNRNSLSASDIDFLVNSARSAIASGNGVLPSDAFFSTVIDPAGNIQPLIVQLQSAKLGNYVWQDNNANGVQDSGEAGVDRVTVQLLDNKGMVIATTTTGDDFSTAAVEHGYYQFNGLKAGDYQVKFIAPTHDFTVANVAGNGQDTVDSDANTVTGLSQVVTLAAGESNQTVDAGLVAKAGTAKLSGYVYEDFGNDGVRDPGEPVIGGVTVTLSGTDVFGNPVTATTTTDAQGFYEFSGLQAGTYTVTESQPGAYLDGKDTAGSTGGNVGVNDVISNVVLAAGGNSVNNNFGELVGAQIRGFVYCDDNNDGIKQATDVGLGGVTVNLTGTDDLGNMVTATTTTAPDGSYLFAGLRPGTYTVTEPTPPADKLDGKDTAGFPGSGVAGNDIIKDIVLTQGSISNDNNFGEILPAAIKGFVYCDDNNDGIKQATDVGIGGVPVRLQGSNDLGQSVDITINTQADGSYAFNGLRPGTYSVTEAAQPVGKLDGKETAGSTGGNTSVNEVISGITVASGQTSTDNNFGEILPPTGQISGVVYCDDNNDGIKQGTEVGIGGTPVRLQGSNDLGQLVDITINTQPDGTYAFTGLRPGTYSVTEAAQPVGKLDGKETAGSTGGNTSVNEVISNIVLGAGQSSTGNNFGEVLPAAITGVVYCDDNNDGIKQGTDVGIGGVPVRLQGTNDLGQAVDVTINTLPDGSYAFTGLRPGTYSVTETTQPAGKLDGKETAGSTGGNTTVNEVISGITVGSGQTSSANNFGEILPAAIKGFVYCDDNNDGIKQATDVGIGGVPVRLQGKNDLGQTVDITINTQPDGSYSFIGLRPGTYSVTETAQPAGKVDGKETAGSTGGNTSVNEVISGITVGAGQTSTGNNFGELLPAKAHIGDLVFEDKNANGVQDSGELGIGSVTVNLCNSAGVVVATTTTDAAGKYGFDVAAGTYSVQVVAPANYVITAKDSGGNTAASDALDSDIDAGGKTGNYVLNAGDVNNTVDGGLYKKASLGDRVWLDANGNGQQDNGEAGKAGVTVNLCDANGNVVATKTTDANGNYLFTDLTPGTYSVQFVAPAGYQLTTKDSGADASDSDADNLTGKTGNYVLASGDSNLTVDAGLLPKIALDLQKTVRIDAAEDCAVGPMGAVDTNGDGKVDSGINLGNLTKYLFVFANGSTDANWQGASKGFSGDVVVDGLQAVERTSGNVPFAGTVYTNDTTLGAWQNIVNSNPTQAAAAVGQTALVSGLETDLNNAFTQINSLTATAGYTGVAATSLNGLNTQDGVNKTYVINVTSGFNVSSAINITGDAGDVFVLRWDTNANAADGYQGQVKFQSGGGINPLGGLTAGNFIHVAGDINASGGGSNLSGLPQGPMDANGNLIAGGANYSGGGFFTGYWLTTGAPGTGDTASLSNAIFNGGWYTLSDKFSLTSGTSGMHVCANPAAIDAAPFNPSDIGTHVAMAQVGDDLVYTYKVTNTGQVTLTAPSVVDDNGTPTNLADDYVPAAVLVGGFNHGDLNKNNLFDVAESWYYQKSNVATATGVITNLATAAASAFGVQVKDIDTATVTVGASKASIGNFVWEDKNANGVQDAGEAGIANVAVKLLNAAGATVATTTTGANGEYLFSNLNPADYKVQVVAPSGYYVTKKDQGGNDALDSDVGASGTTVMTTLTAGENDLSWDAGLYRKASVGDKVFQDANHNNIQDVGEAGIGGVSVKLLSSAGTVLASTTTNSAGNYQFSNIDPGSYMLQFDKKDVMFSGVNMSTWKWAVKDTGANDAVDSDVTGDAVSKTNVSNTDVFTLASGQSDQTRDAGITPIVIDLDGNGIHTTSRADSTGGFDLFGNGVAVQSGWISGGDGFLAVDRNGNGKVDSISELFGGNTKGAGFANLAGFDSNGDGLVNNLDANFGQLMIWRDANGNHSTDAGEMISLGQAGVASLTVAYTELPFIDAQGNMHLERSSATLDSGASVAMTDVYFNVSAADAKAAGVALPTMADLLGDDRAMDVVVGGSDMVNTCQARVADDAGNAHCGDAGEAMRRLAALTREEHHAQAA